VEEDDGDVEGIAEAREAGMLLQAVGVHGAHVVDRVVGDEGTNSLPETGRPVILQLSKKV
jgi:hypothetical protein